jgi:hypothetical protein
MLGTKHCGPRGSETHPRDALRPVVADTVPLVRRFLLIAGNRTCRVAADRATRDVANLAAGGGATTARHSSCDTED